MSRRRVSDEERALLDHAMRAVTPIAKRRKTTAPPPAQAAPATNSGARPAAVHAGNLPARPAKPAAARRPSAAELHAIDRRTEQKLKRGQMEIGATLDLHGLSQERAHKRLNSFLARAALDGKRTVLVITGKGRAGPGEEGSISRGRGVLREAVPRWIAAPPLRDLVWGMRPAGRAHGGAGALYVLLKKVK